MTEPKFKLNQIAYFVKDYKLIQVKILEIHIIKKSEGTMENTFVEYVITPTITPDNKIQPKTTRECYLVEDFKTAQQSAITNTESIFTSVLAQLKLMTEECFNVQPINNEQK